MLVQPYAFYCSSISVTPSRNVSGFFTTIGVVEAWLSTGLHTCTIARASTLLALQLITQDAPWAMLVSMRIDLAERYIALDEHMRSISPIG
jgi:hypothetical protein